MGGFRTIVAGAATLLTMVGCSASDAPGVREHAGVTSKLVVAPPLETKSGELCFTDLRDFHVAVGTEEPQDGWISIDAPHSEAVLGGTGVSGGATAATSSVSFVVTSLAATWNNSNYGPLRRTCAEIGVTNACNLTRACWLSNGSWAVERKSNPGMESLEECGEGGVTTLRVSGVSELLPSLTETPTNVQEIGITASRTPVEQLTVTFKRNDVTLRTVNVPGPLPSTFEGFAGVRNDRMKVRIVARGLADACPGVGTCGASGTSTVASDSVSPEREGFACGYYDHYQPPFRPMPASGPLTPLQNFTATMVYFFTRGACRAHVDLNFVAPPEAVKVHTYKDGHAYYVKPPAGGFTVARGLLDGHSYSFQAVWEDSSGNLSQPATRRVTIPTGCSPSRGTDGYYDAAVVPFYYQGRGDQSLTRTQIHNIVFGDASTGMPASPAVYVNELSRGRVQLRGDTFDWIPLQGSWEDECQGRNVCAIGTPLPAQAAARGLNLAPYEFVMFFVSGGTGNLDPSWQSADELFRMNESGVSNLVIHEFLGHGLSELNHAGGYRCDGTVLPGPNVADARGARSLQFPSQTCGTWAYWDDFSPMGASSTGYYHTMHLHQIRWIDDAEVARDEFGGTYTLGKLTGASPIKQLRVHLYDNTFYFAEYRTGEGLDVAPRGVQIRLWQPAPNLYLDPVVHPIVPPSYEDGEGLLVTNGPLGNGTSYCDPDRKVKIEVLGTDDSAAQIRVTRAPCTPSLSPLGASCSSATECASGECLGGVCYTTPRQVATGGNFACARFEDGSIRCWGRNDEGQLGIAAPGPIGDSPSELGVSLTPIPLSGQATAFALGKVHGCALLATGEVECWGRNLFGQLGAGDTSPRVGATVKPSLGGLATHVAAGANFTCAILTGGAVKCWGANNYGQLGIGSNQNVGDRPNEMGENLPAINLPVGAAKIVAGDNHACARLLTGEVRCWGLAASGQLGVNAGMAYGDTSTETTPQPVPLGTSFRAQDLAAGANHTCALMRPVMKCWGGSPFGQLGYGDTLSRGNSAATMGDSLPVVPVPPVRQITAGGNVTCALDFDGPIRCWGASGPSLGQPALSASGHLGDAPGEVSASMPAVSLGSFTPLTVQAAAGLTCALSSVTPQAPGGGVKCWGGNAFGELGQGDTAARGDDVSDMGANLPTIALP